MLAISMKHPYPYDMRYFAKIKKCSAVLVAISAICLASTSTAQLIPGGQPGAGNTNNQAPANAAPQPTVKNLYPVWVGYIVIGLMIAAVMGVSLMPSKRSHQD